MTVHLNIDVSSGVELCWPRPGLWEAVQEPRNQFSALRFQASVAEPTFNRRDHHDDQGHGESWPIQWDGGTGAAGSRDPAKEGTLVAERSGRQGVFPGPFQHESR